MLITNPNRKKQLDEFLDKNHDVMMKYYEVVDSNKTQAEIVKAMRKFMELDPDFYDPFYIVADDLFEEGRNVEGTALLKYAYERAMMQIVDAKGRWPKEMVWGYLENRHLMRIIERYGICCWDNGNIDEALEIFRQLYKANPNDNQGVRFHIVAIRTGLTHKKWLKQFESEYGIGFNKVSEWFVKNAKKFPEDFPISAADNQE